MSRRTSIATIVAFATIVAAGVLGIVGCTPRVPSATSPRPAPAVESSAVVTPLFDGSAFENTAPPSPGSGVGTIVGYITGYTSLVESGDNPSLTTSKYIITVRWGTPKLDKQSDLLIAESTVLELGGVEATATTAKAKHRAINRYMAHRSQVPSVSVSYVASEDAGVSTSTSQGYPYSVVTRVVSNAK